MSPPRDRHARRWRCTVTPCGDDARRRRPPLVDVVAVTLVLTLAWGCAPVGSAAPSSWVIEDVDTSGASLAWAAMSEDVFAFYGMDLKPEPARPPSPPSPPPSPSPPPVAAVRWTESGKSCAIPFLFKGGGPRKSLLMLVHHNGCETLYSVTKPSFPPHPLPRTTHWRRECLKLLVSILYPSLPPPPPSLLARFGPACLVSHLKISSVHSKKNKQKNKQREIYKNINQYLRR